jgi:hypothetical protein
MNAISTKTRKWAAAAIGATGLIHLVLAPEYFGEQAYIGVLFLGGAAVCGYVAAKVWTGRAIALDWTLGALTAAGMFAGFILSRTVGLPGFHESEWELSGVISLLLEAGFIGAAVAVLRSAGKEEPRAVAGRRGAFVTSE